MQGGTRVKVAGLRLRSSTAPRDARTACDATSNPTVSCSVSHSRVQANACHATGIAILHELRSELALTLERCDACKHAGAQRILHERCMTIGPAKGERVVRVEQCSSSRLKYTHSLCRCERISRL